MNKPVLGGMAVALLSALAAASVYAAPSVARVQPQADPRITQPKIALPAPPPPAEIACPLSVDVDHSVNTPPGFRSFSASIRSYSRSICQGPQAMHASNMSRTVSCYYCDQQRTQVLRMDAPYPEGRNHCERLGTSYRFQCK